MNKHVKPLALAALLCMTAGAALAADKAMDCCCKDKDGKMTCCDEMKTQEGAKGGAEQASPEHKH